MAADPFFEIPYYHDYLSPALATHLLENASEVEGIPNLVEVGGGGGLETTDALRFLVELYDELKDHLARVLAQRPLDRKFIDERVKACAEFNRSLGRDWLDADYKTVLGLEDANGRIVIGPKSANYCRVGGKPIAPLPEFLEGPHVTLFGPPDSAKMAINAMNAYHRKLAGEPPIVADLIGKYSPMWGADDEDSKTPLRSDLVEAAVNLTRCFDGNLELEEGEKKYALADDHLALPIKRFPGLALPASFLFYRGNPIPLHLYDFALHLFWNRKNPRALVYYVPKLENEEEAAYIHAMVAAAERRIQRLSPDYKDGSVRLMIVLENPRAILRTHEIIDSLHPYFAGASLGWHDYLASTARVFKEDANYRIPVKADPDIVIKYIKASHRLLADAVGSRGGIKVGGMYGILPLAGERKSLQVTLKGFVKDVITQLRRDLTGFWVAHPDFVRLGLAFVAAWKRRADGDPRALNELVGTLLDTEYQKEVFDLIEGDDIEGLDIDDPGYVRSLLVADIKESDFIANNDPEEIRYNVFQSLQYLADWLCGNGCVALPTLVGGVPVRVMDDLATAERSRWEVWHELRHRRFAIEDFIRIAHEELVFIRRDLSNETKIVQVKWDERTAKWYPVAFKLMLQLMTAPEPAEFATELLMPFTIESIRASDDPWASARKLDPGKYRLEKYVADLDHYFEICGVPRFAQQMAERAVEDLDFARELVMNFSLDEILSAASFHGDIGDSKKVLDPRAAGEQSLVLREEDATKRELRELGAAYLKKFGFKFLISAQGKRAGEIRSELVRRTNGTREQEMQNARIALWEISRKRLEASSQTASGSALATLEALRKKHEVIGVSIALNYANQTQCLSFGNAEKGGAKVTSKTCFELASLSKTIASAFALEYFAKAKLPLTTSVNVLLAETASRFRLRSEGDPAWADEVTIAHLMNHTALNLHYVKGFSAKSAIPPLTELLDGRHGYDPVAVIGEPGHRFKYSGAGFMVLEHLIEAREGKSIADLMRPFLSCLGAPELTFSTSENLAHGYFDSGEEVPGGHFVFPALAAGAFGTSAATARFLSQLTRAFQKIGGSGALAHETAVRMLHGRDLGARDFMGCDIGLGVFTIEAGRSRWALHQGANEGFRALFLQCYDGPDLGKGLVIFCNADNRGVRFIAEAAREILRAFDVSGVDFEISAHEFRFDHLEQEQIVNLGYKQLLFSAFQPDLPEKIVAKGPLDPLADLNLVVGAKVISVSNQKFARAENLISPHLPVFDPELFGRQGKIMDSWESARHNREGRDTLILKLKRTSEIRYVSLSTKFHDGNQAEHVRLEGLSEKGDWIEILPKTALAGHALLSRRLESATAKVSHIKVEMFPDGGLSRLALFRDLPDDIAVKFRTDAKPVRYSDSIPKSRKPLTIRYEPSREEIARNLRRAACPIDHASQAFGGEVVRASNEHYGPAAQVTSPYPALHMFDGLESARSREAGHHEEVHLRLGQKIRIDCVVFDFTYFVNNNPLAVSALGLQDGGWVEILPRTEVKAFAANRAAFNIECADAFAEVKIKTFPDGGINRIKVFGQAAPA